MRTALLIAAVMGMRRGEIFGLKWADIDIGRAILRVRRSYADRAEGTTKDRLFVTSVANSAAGTGCTQGMEGKVIVYWPK